MARILWLVFLWHESYWPAGQPAISWPAASLMLRAESRNVVGKMLSRMSNFICRAAHVDCILNQGFLRIRHTNSQTTETGRAPQLHVAPGPVAPGRSRQLQTFWGLVRLNLARLPLTKTGRPFISGILLTVATRPTINNISVC